MYASMVDRVKLALLPHVPGRLALCLHADILARQILHHLVQVRQGEQGQAAGGRGTRALYQQAP